MILNVDRSLLIRQYRHSQSQWNYITDIMVHCTHYHSKWFLKGEAHAHRQDVVCYAYLTAETDVLA